MNLSDPGKRSQPGGQKQLHSILFRVAHSCRHWFRTAYSPGSILANCAPAFSQFWQSILYKNYVGKYLANHSAFDIDNEMTPLRKSGYPSLGKTEPSPV
jgi:hypothetical protein